MGSHGVPEEMSRRADLRLVFCFMGPRLCHVPWVIRRSSHRRNAGEGARAMCWAMPRRRHARAMKKKKAPAEAGAFGFRFVYQLNFSAILMLRLRSPNGPVFRLRKL